jgi:hypothetical protein
MHTFQESQGLMRDKVSGRKMLKRVDAKRVRGILEGFAGE